MATALPSNREDLRACLGETGLPEAIVRHLAEQARPALALRATILDEAAIPLGASKIGGAPDLPAGTSWPLRPPYVDGEARAAEHRHRAASLLTQSARSGSWMTPEQGRRLSAVRNAQADAAIAPFPLAFLAQLDLATLSREAGFDPLLPDHGRLSVFFDYWETPAEFDPHSAAGFRLAWDASPVEGLVRAAPPEALTRLTTRNWTCVFGAAAVSAETVTTAIPLSDKSWDAFPLDDEEACGAYGAWLSQFGAPDEAGGHNHQLGGFPRPLQNGMQARSQLAANGLYCGDSDGFRTPAAQELMKTASGWRLVLQIGREDGIGLLPAGCLYVLMREADIRARAFSRAWFVYQCD